MPVIQEKSQLAEMLTIQEAAKLLDVCTAKLISMVKSGEIKGLKFGGRWRFKREEIESFIAKLLD